MLSQASWATLSWLTRFSLFVIITCLVFVSAFFLLSQTVRTASNQSWRGNGDTLVIGASYAIVVRLYRTYILQLFFTWRHRSLCLWQST
jgi:hypothetical protein